MAGGTPLADKTISFTLNGAPVCGVSGKPSCPKTNSSGVATLTGVSLAGIDAGSYPDAIGASFAGDGTHASATGSANLTVEPAEQTIDFDALPNQTFGDDPFTLSASASSGLSVTFQLGTGSVGCSLSGSTVTLTGATPSGQFCVIVAKQAGNNNYNPAPDVSRSFSIAKAPTTTVVATSKTPTVYGEPVTFTATVSAIPSGLTGSVTFKDGGTAIGTDAVTCGATCTAQLTTKTLLAATHTITAVYGGDANFEGSTSAGITQQVNRAETNTALGASSYTATYGDQELALGASVTAKAPSEAVVGEGAVRFTVKQGTTEKGSVTGSVNNGSATANFPLFGVDAGDYTVEAVYQPASSSPNFLASGPASSSLTVNRAQTLTSIGLPSGPYLRQWTGRGHVHSASQEQRELHQSQPTGTVEVKNSSTSCSATLPAQDCNYTPTTVGHHDLTANYSGDGNYLPSASSVARITVTFKFLDFLPPWTVRAPITSPRPGGDSAQVAALGCEQSADRQPNRRQNIAIGSLNCGSTSSADLIEEYASGSSGLHNLGDGNYQFNWKTPTGYANSCKNIGLDFGNGYVELALANFNFKK